MCLKSAILQIFNKANAKYFLFKITHYTQSHTVGEILLTKTIFSHWF